MPCKSFLLSLIPLTFHTTIDKPKWLVVSYAMAAAGEVEAVAAVGPKCCWTPPCVTFINFAPLQNGFNPAAFSWVNSPPESLTLLLLFLGKIIIEEDALLPEVPALLVRRVFA